MLNKYILAHWEWNEKFFLVLFMPKRGDFGNFFGILDKTADALSFFEKQKRPVGCGRNSSRNNDELIKIYIW